MAYDTALAAGIREALASEREVAEPKMFGGLTFLVGGHMTVVARGQGGLMLRADPTTTATLVDTTPAVSAEMRGRTTNGWLRLDAPTSTPTVNSNDGSTGPSATQPRYRPSNRD